MRKKLASSLILTASGIGMAGFLAIGTPLGTVFADSITQPMAPAHIHKGHFTNAQAKKWNAEITRAWDSLTPAQKQNIIDQKTKDIKAAPFGVDTSKLLWDSTTKKWVANPGYDQPRGYSYCPKNATGLNNPLGPTPQAMCGISDRDNPGKGEHGEPPSKGNGGKDKGIGNHGDPGAGNGNQDKGFS